MALWAASDVITLKPEMYLKLMKAWQLPEGVYVLDKKNVSG